jgi:hypothetical protein
MRTWKCSECGQDIPVGADESPENLKAVLDAHIKASKKALCNRAKPRFWQLGQWIDIDLLNKNGSDRAGARSAGPRGFRRQ